MIAKSKWAESFSKNGAVFKALSQLYSICCIWTPHFLQVVSIQKIKVRLRLYIRLLNGWLNTLSHNEDFARAIQIVNTASKEPTTLTEFSALVLPIFHQPFTSNRVDVKNKSLVYITLLIDVFQSVKRVVRSTVLHFNRYQL